MHTRRITAFVVLLLCGCKGDSTSPSGDAPTITITATTIELRGFGVEQTVTANVSPAGAPVSWVSETPSVATVTGSGASVKVKAIAAGTARINATVNSGGKQASTHTQVTVVPVVKSVVLSATGGGTITLGETRQVTATVTADAGANQSLMWTSSDDTRATVSNTGLVTTLATGPVTITATSAAFPSVKAQLVFTINPQPAVTSVTVSPATDEVLVGNTRAFTAAVLADAPLSTAVTWSTSDPLKATISNTGVATGVAPGTVTITATSVADNSKKGTATLEVRTPTVRTIAVTLQATLQEGLTAQATPRVTADPGVSTAVQWSSSNTQVATVSQSGVVTAIAPGNAQITATSVSFPAVSGRAAIAVSPNPGFTNWVNSRAGVIGNQITDGVALDAVALVNNNSLVNWWGFADGNSAAFHLRVGNGTVTDVGDPSVPIMSGVTTFDGVTAYGISGNKLYRYNGTWQEMTPAPPGNVSAVDAISGGRAIAFTRDNGGSVYLWNGTSWALITTLATGAQDNLVMRAFDTNAIMVMNCMGNRTIRVWNGTIWTTLPAAPGASPGICGPVRGTGVDDLYYLLDVTPTRVFRWNGASWSTMQAGLPSEDRLQMPATCNSQLHVSTVAGRVFRWNGSTFVRLGTDDDLIGERHFGTSTKHIFCSIDNSTLRLASNQGALQRWTGNAWVTETFAPQFRSLSIVSPTLAWAGSGGADVYRYNGATWQRMYHAVDNVTRRPSSLVGYNDGKLVAVLSTSIAPQNEAPSGGFENHALRFDGIQWIRDQGPALSTLNGVWGTSYDNTFGVTGAGNVMRFDGSSWTAAHVAGQQLSFIDGVAGYALAVGRGLFTVRWNGSAWSNVISPSGSAPVVALDVVAPDVAFAATANTVYRFDGTQWTEVMTGLPAGRTVYDVFGTGPRDMYLLYGEGFGTTRELYRFNGTQWSLVTSYAPGARNFGYVGEAIPGMAFVMGTNGLLVRGTQ